MVKIPGTEEMVSKHLTIEKKTLEKLTKIATKRKIPVNQLIREIIEGYLKKGE